MRLTRILLLAAVTACAGVLGSCDSLLDPEGDGLVPGSELTFVRVAPDAPPLADTVVSFWVKPGEDREVQITYTYANGNGKCLLFRVPGNSLLSKPDGSAFAPGDSLRVTVRVTDTDLFSFQFEPAGLRFDPAHPAQLEVRYRWADPDYNGDGVVDAGDEALAAEFGFWKQEEPGEGWAKVTTTRFADILEAHASIEGFTIYALAVD